MGQYNIILNDDDEIACIETISSTNTLSVTDYLTNICRGWIQNQLRGQYIQAAKVADLPELKAALNVIVEKIKETEKLKARGG